MLVSASVVLGLASYAKLGIDLFPNIDIPVANRNGQPVRIRDVGDVADSFEEPRGLSRLWSKQAAERQGHAYVGDAAVSLIVQKQSGANTVALTDRIRQRLGEIRTLLPPDIEVEP